MTNLIFNRRTENRAFRGLSGTYNVRANERDRATTTEVATSHRRNVECLVQFLDNTQHKFFIDRRSKGQSLLDCVFKHLNLIETDFFGLKYTPQPVQQPPASEVADSQTDIKSDTLSCKTSFSNINNNNSSSDCGANHDNNAIHTTANHSPKSNCSTHSPTSNQSKPASATHNNVSLKSRTNTSGIISSQNDIGSNYINSNGSQSNTRYCNNINLARLQQRPQPPLPTINKDERNHFDQPLEERWLDPTKSIRKQYKPGPPYIFYFRVKFYVSDPSKLADDTTRNHLYLQLRQDILNNRLIVPASSAILLASYILQSEVGDYKRELLTEDYVSRFHLLPVQSDDIKKKIVEIHKQHKSLSPADAEYQFLEHAAKELDCYGVEFYEAIDHNSIPVQIGVSSNGIVVFKDAKRISQFSWAKIIKIMFKKRIFSIQLRREEGDIWDNLIEYNLLTNHACKSFWEECVAQHSFFRLHQPKSPPKKFFSFLNFGSKFQYNGKTEYQTMEESRKRSFSHFSRTPSKRYARRTLPIGRPSWVDEATSTPPQTTAVANNTISHHDIKIPSNHNRTDNLFDNVDVSIDEKPSIATKNTKHETSWLLAPVAPSSSACTASNTKPVGCETPYSEALDQRLNAFKPKSLTLKSFTYIDESKSTPGSESSVPDQNGGNNRTIRHFTQADDGQGASIGNFTDQKKSFRRSESLRISNSIREAISLTKKAGVSSSSHLVKISETLRDKFLVGKSKQRKGTEKPTDTPSEKEQDNSDDEELCGKPSSGSRPIKVVRLTPGKDKKYGFKVREISIDSDGEGKEKKSRKSKMRSIIVYDVREPQTASEPRLCDGDRLVAINGVSVEGLSINRVETMIKSMHQRNPPDLVLDIDPTCNVDCNSVGSSESQSDSNLQQIPTRHSPADQKQSETLAQSIELIRKKLKNGSLIEDFEKLSRKKDDETHEESRLMENIDKNRYQDILPYDSTRVTLLDSMTGDYINASFVLMSVPSGIVNRYIATQGPLSSTCDDFWQMVWEQNSSLIIMVTPLIEGGRVKCHKYWPDEKEDVRYGQLLVRNLCEKSKTATIDRTIQLLDIKSGEKRTTTQIQYKAWPDHEVPEDCSDFLKLVNRVKKHRASRPDDPIVVHCSAGIGRTGVLILMETAICIMESRQPIDPIEILTEMRKQRAMLIQTSSQFQFVAEAICKVYDQKLYSKSRKRRKK